MSATNKTWSEVNWPEVESLATSLLSYSGGNVTGTKAGEFKLALRAAFQGKISPGAFASNREFSAALFVATRQGLEKFAKLGLVLDKVEVQGVLADLAITHGFFK